MNNIIHIHTDDLRLEDNKSITESSKQGTVTPIYVYDKEILSHYGEQYKEHLHNALRHLQKQYEKQNTTLHIINNTFENTIRNLNNHAINITYPNRNIFLQKKLQHISTSQNVAVTHNIPINVETAQEGIRKAQKYLQKPTLSAPNIDYKPLPFSTQTKQIQQTKNLNKHYNQRLRLLKSTIRNYGLIVGNPYLAEQQSSRISHIIATGTKSIRQAYQDTKKIQSQTILLDRHLWNIRFKQKAHKNPSLHKEPLNKYFNKHNYYQPNKKKHRAWTNAQTGYPLVDAAMNALNKTGYTNFRMRALLATFYTHILKQPWWKGATYMHKKLIDADPTINYYQWQMQSNTLGIHPLRIYNPHKQQKEKDPRAKYIHKYIETLRETSPEDITKQKLPKTYPDKIVNYKKQSQKTRNWFKQHKANIIRQAKKQNLTQQALLSKQSQHYLEKEYNKVKNTLDNYT